MSQREKEINNLIEVDNEQATVIVDVNETMTSWEHQYNDLQQLSIGKPKTNIDRCLLWDNAINVVITNE